jgi:hypothetical protein
MAGQKSGWGEGQNSAGLPFSSYGSSLYYDFGTAPFVR